jgi:hypothetical protein
MEIKLEPRSTTEVESDALMVVGFAGEYTQGAAAAEAIKEL